ncbi:MAG: peptide-methionine (S)-S-oxide reductase MsrA [Pseudomonadota bacterium]
MFFSQKKSQMPTPEDALQGRDTPIITAQNHYVLNVPLKGPYPQTSEQVLFGMGCFWGAEKMFWPLKGIHITAVGYAGGYTPNPTYEEVCTGKTGHNEVVLMVYDPQTISFEILLKVFWENHDPTQGMRQGNDVGTQYRSGIYTRTQSQNNAANASKEKYQDQLGAKKYGEITTEIIEMPEFYFAQEDHQQYLAKNPSGYCGLGGTGVSCQITS